MHMVILDFVYFDGEKGAKSDVECELVPGMILFNLCEETWSKVKAGGGSG